jgi:hypothetical protein
MVALENGQSVWCQRVDLTFNNQGDSWFDGQITNCRATSK